MPAGEAFVRGSMLSLFANAGSTAADVYAGPAAPQPDYETPLPGAVNFGAAIGGAHVDAVLRHL
jgi:hypothetical protein